LCLWPSWKTSSLPAGHFEDNVYESAAHAGVLDKDLLAQLKPQLETIKPLPAVFDQYYVKRLHGTHVKKGKNKRDLAEQVRADIQAFKKTWTGW